MHSARNRGLVARPHRPRYGAQIEGVGARAGASAKWAITNRCTEPKARAITAEFNAG